jgi:D-alanine transaminase
MTVYWNGQLMAEQDVHVSPNDRGLQFGDGVYEVVAAYEGRLYRLDQHLRRLAYSLQAVRIAFDGIDRIRTAIQELIGRNKFEKETFLAYIQVTRGTHKRGHPFPPASVLPNVYVSLSRYERHLKEFNEGAKVILVGDTRWARCDIKTIALLPNVLARQTALEAGAAEALFVRDGMVLEGTHTSWAGIQAGRLVTPALSNYLLPGVTRAALLEFCRALGIPSEERSVPEAELSGFEELMLVGTTAEITPIIAIDGRSAGGGRPGPLTRRLQKALGAEAGF